MTSTKNIKILTLLQLCTVVVVVAAVWFFVRPQNFASAATCGMIDGILFSPDNPSVLIDGQVLKIGDQIYGVQVVGIGRRIVTFEREGETWDQRVRERPNKGWDEADTPDSDTADLPTQVALPKKPPTPKQAAAQPNASSAAAQPTP